MWTAGWPSKCRAMASAVSELRCTRRNSVRMPRCRSHASNGPGTAPAMRRHERMRCQNGIVAGADHRAGQHVAVAVQVLGGGVHDEIGAERQRPRQHRRRHRVVHGHPRAGGMGEPAHGGEVGDLPGGIGRRLDPHETRGAGADRGFHRRQVRHVDELDVEPPGQAELGEPLAHSPVEHLRDNDMIARDERLEDGIGRGHSGGEQDAARAALEGRQQPLGMLVGRIVRARVDPVLVIGAVRPPARSSSTG